HRKLRRLTEASEARRSCGESPILRRVTERSERRRSCGDSPKLRSPTEASATLRVFYAAPIKTKKGGARTKRAPRDRRQDSELGFGAAGLAISVGGSPGPVRRRPRNG